MTSTILAIDDDPVNLDIITSYLEENKDYEVITAADGVEGWDILSKSHQDIKLILVDRMMPNMDGMELSKMVLDDSEMSNIPIIMQTAAAEKKQVEEGIKLGVYYYLTKPYEEDKLLALVKSAIDSYNIHENISKEIKNNKDISPLLEEDVLYCRTLTDVQELSPKIAKLFPDPERVIIGIVEILTNAIEHGNLNISYHNKTQFLNNNCWKQEVERRLSLQENLDKKVTITVSRSESELKLTVKDDGQGFEWKKYMDISPNRVTDNHGRGIALSKLMSFDKIEYKHPGNEVDCIINLNGERK